jgi:glycine betaine/proline transport system permease protein
MEDGGWLLRFPELSRDALRAIKKSFDFGYRQFSRTYGEAIENVFEPLLQFLIWFEDFFTETPWMLIILGIATLAWLASRSWKLVIGIVVSFMLIGVFGMWEHTMQTMAMIVVCTILALIIGLPIGILMSRYDRAQSAIMPILDVMQTMPSFVYLIPVVMLLGIGRVPGLIAVIIYAVPPMIRLTNLGIRLVDK